MPPDCSSLTLRVSLSTQMTSCPASAKHVPVTSPTYPVPMIVSFIRVRPDGTTGAIMAQKAAVSKLNVITATPVEQECYFGFAVFGGGTVVPVELPVGGATRFVAG